MLATPLATIGRLAAFAATGGALLALCRPLPAAEPGHAALACPAPTALARPAPAAALGAPLICFPLEVADEALLPFERGSQAKPTVAVAELPVALAQLLAAHPDPLLHMEALRRTALCLGDDAVAAPSSCAAAQPTHFARLLAALEAAVVAAELLPADDPAAPARRALAWFDLGYAREVGATMGLTGERGGSCLAKACRLQPDAPLLRFGTAMVAFQEERIERAVDGTGAPISAGDWRDHLRHAMVGTPSPLLARNLVSTFGAFLNHSTFEALRAAVASGIDSRDR